jgi:copper chaperone
MAIKLKVPSIACEVCGETITKAIKSELPEAEVKVDVANKTVAVETSVSEERIKNIITSAGHTV